ncbi:hypothetical protein N657DRAFT_670058 [Parathielavia appendiculata]|uniref:Uncharacterized protein n=1 Tax=Parathielavia appendiculata TaxID=2587402 RepID=A0AAN6Z4Z6_9PEZI|nr:hypothetical protein N657DRAFT_670058 [Parathielavia appendiculata]
MLTLGSFENRLKFLPYAKFSPSLCLLLLLGFSRVLWPFSISSLKTLSRHCPPQLQVQPCQFDQLSLAYKANMAAEQATQFPSPLQSMDIVDLQRYAATALREMTGQETGNPFLSPTSMAVGTAFLNGLNSNEAFWVVARNLGFAAGRGARDIHTFVCLASGLVENLDPYGWNLERNPIPSTATRVIIIAAVPMNHDEATQYDGETAVQNISWGALEIDMVNRRFLVVDPCMGPSPGRIDSRLWGSFQTLPDGSVVNGLYGFTLLGAVAQIVLGDPWFRQADLSLCHVWTNIAIERTAYAGVSGIFVLEWALQRFLSFGVAGSERIVPAADGLQTVRLIFSVLSRHGRFFPADSGLEDLLGDSV